MEIFTKWNASPFVTCCCLFLSMITIIKRLTRKGPDITLKIKSPFYSSQNCIYNHADRSIKLPIDTTKLLTFGQVINTSY